MLLYSFLIFFSCFYWRLGAVVLRLGSGMESPALASACASEEARQPLMLAFLALLALAMAAYLRPSKGEDAQDARAFAAVALFFCWLSLRLLLFQESLLGPAAQLPYLSMLAGFGALLLFLGFVLMRGYSKPWILALAGFFGYALVQGLSLAFPLGAQSDMLPLIRSAGRDFVAGRSPYSVQQFLGESMRTTYLPGMWLSYLPFSMLGLDLRLGNLAFTAAFSFFAYRCCRSRPRPAAMLALLLLNPWLGYRHELYLSAYLWSLACFAFALAEGRRQLAAFSFGWGLACYPFAWFLLPIWAAWEWRRSGKAAAMKSLGQALALAALLLLPFLIWDARGFYEGVLGHWIGSVELSHYNFMHWIPAPCLPPIQAAACLLGALWAWKSGPALSGLYRACAVSLAVFLLANAHGSHYFFFIFAALLFFHEAAQAGAPTQAAPRD